MEIEMLEEKDKKIIVNIKNEDIGFFSMLSDELNNIKDVKFAGYNVDHPLIRNIKLLIELKDDSKSNPKIVLEKALNNCKKSQDTLVKDFLKETKYKN